MKVKSLIRQTFFYSGGQIAARALNFMLLPLTTRYLNPEDYGVIGQLALMGQLLSCVFSLGFAVSISRSYSALGTEDERDSLMLSSMCVLMLHGSVMCALGALCSSFVSRFLFGRVDYAPHVMLSLVSLWVGSLLIPFQLRLRLKGRALFAMCAALAEVAATLFVTLYLVIVHSLACKGQLIGALSGQLIGALLLCLMNLPGMKLQFHVRRYFFDLLKTGFPYIFSLLSYFVLANGGRYLCLRLGGLEESGLYFMGQNLGRVVELFVTGFLSAWPPFALRYLERKEEAACVFGRVLTYYALALGAALAAVFAFARPVALLLLAPKFHAVWNLVGLSALQSVLWGAYSVTTVGTLFQKKEFWQACIEIISVFVSLLFSFVFYIKFGLIGISLGSLFGFVFLISLSFSLNQSLLRVHYEVGLLLRVAIWVAAIALLSFVPMVNLWSYCGVMTAALAASGCDLWRIYGQRARDFAVQA